MEKMIQFDPGKITEVITEVITYSHNLISYDNFAALLSPENTL